MPNQINSTPDAPESSDSSRAVKAGNTVHAGGIDVATGAFARPTLGTQARRARLNVHAVTA